VTRPIRWLWRELTRPRGVRPHPRHARWRAAMVRGRRRSRDSRSGVALLVVVSAIMIITVLVSEMNYGARVRLLLAAHQKEEVQAYWLARTGINIYKLILAGNMALKNSSIADYGGMFGVNLGDALWQAVPFLSTGLMRMIFVSGGDIEDIEEEELREVTTTGTVSDEIAEQSREELSTGHFSDKHFLDFDGDFNASIVDEDSKVNLNGFASRSSESILQEELTATTLYGIMSGQEQDQWFYDRDIDRWEIIGNIADWVDTDNTRCGLRSGYEDDLYNRVEPDPYLAKNAPFDTKEEIKLVDGWEDEVYEKYEDRITVWGSGKININTASPEVMFGLLKAYSEGTPADSVVEQCQSLMAEMVLFSDWQSADEFAEWVGNNCGCIPDENMKNVITTSSSVFTITSMGVVGDTTVTITAVLDYSSGSGTMKYWRVD
jgi:general secretion pathway protein K